MLVPDEVRQCVLFLGNKDAKTGKFRPRATAFVVSLHEDGFVFRYVVTAEHNISGFALKNWDIYLRSNTINGPAREDSWSTAHWFFHPDSGSSDVAVASIDFHPNEEFKTILLRSDGSTDRHGMAGTWSELQKRDIGLGDEVFIVGLFRSHFGQQRNIPIIRVGNLAMVKGEPVSTKYCGYTEAYLVEARSISGLSGSPVFINVPIFHPGGGTVTQFFLLGLMHGHFDIKNMNEDIVLDSDDDTPGGINTGIGVVIPVEKIIETLDQPELAEMRKKAAKAHREKNGATADFDDPQANDENPTHREDFMRLADAAARKPAPKD
jgi:hypothetical protein